jgi:hypothetical protein
LEELAALNMRGELPDLSVTSGFLRQDEATNPVQNDETNLPLPSHGLPGDFSGHNFN